MFVLKLLGNDAAHIHAKAFNNIDKDEINIAVDLTKELLQALYQLDDLVKKLENLKTKKP
jgi:hypothetical protein